MKDVEQAWQDYRGAMERCATATKLATFYAREAAESTERCCQQTLLALYHIKANLAELREELNEHR